MKRVIIIIGALVIAVLIAVGSFWGGMAYQTRQASQARADFFSARGGNNGQFRQGGGTGEGFPQSGGQNPVFFGARGTTGQIKSIEGNVMTLSTPQNVTTVNLSDSTQIVKSVSGTTSDLQPGTRVVVSGEQAKDGSITANRITILNTDTGVFAGPPPAGMAP